MTETTKEQAVETPADKAIAAEIRKIDRSIVTQRKHINDAQILIKGYEAQRGVLVQAQIERLQSQLPKDAE